MIDKNNLHRHMISKTTLNEMYYVRGGKVLYKMAMFSPQIPALLLANGYKRHDVFDGLTIFYRTVDELHMLEHHIEVNP